MLGRITPTENTIRWNTPNRKLPTSNKTDKTKLRNQGRYLLQTPLRAHEDLDQPNNDDIIDQEVWTLLQQLYKSIIQESEDWRKFRAKLVSMERTDFGTSGELGQDWAHEIATPEKGCLLVAKRPNLGMFSESAILILQHDDSTSTLGLILNTPSPSKLENTFIRGWKAGRFGKERIYFGGPLEMNSLHILHSHGSLKKSTKVVDGVYLGGFADAQEKVETGIIPAEDFKLIVGFSSWGAYQLAREIQDDVWFVVSASKSLLLQKDDGGLTDQFHEDYWMRILRLSGLEVPY